MVASEKSGPDSLAIIFHSGAYDKVNYGLIIAKAALSLGFDVISHFTYGALKRLTKDEIDSMGNETGSDTREILERGLAMGIINPISQQIKDAKRIGLSIHACVTTLTLFGLSKSDLIPEVDGVRGIATFLDEISKSSKVIYI
jgi:peroxiredoxin family protein